MTSTGTPTAAHTDEVAPGNGAGRDTSDPLGRGGLLTSIEAKLDPLGWFPAIATVTGRAATNSAALTSAAVRLAFGMSQVPASATLRALTGSATDPVPPAPADRRFDSPAWHGNPMFYALQQCYLLGCRYVDDILQAGSAGDDLADRKARMAVHLALDALSPTNTPLTNPDVLATAWRTRGRSLVDGARLAADDLLHRRGMPLKVDTSGFELGVNLAATPGKVIYRNELIELIQYAPQTEAVHAVPLLCSPPWINRYYVMDLAPQRSFVEWAVRGGRTVFMISYRNPDESMRDLRMDDYLRLGPLAALDVVTAVTGSSTVDIASLCLGGALAGMAAAYLAATGDDRVGTLSMFNTLLDYSEPGELGCMVDPDTLRRIESRMAEHGYLPAEDMATTFDMLRARDLIFRYIPSRWLKGEQPAAFDILAWNEDSTRMPAAMHSEYLRTLYGENQLAKGQLTMAGQRLDLGAVTADAYVVGAINDHIVPWRASYASTHLLGGAVRYVLSSGGHIAGIVNPPSPKAWSCSTPEGAGYPDDPEQWRESATRRGETWWHDWLSWSTARAGGMVKPPKMGSRKHKVLEDAPGTYVRS